MQGNVPNFYEQDTQAFEAANDPEKPNTFESSSEDLRNLYKALHACAEAYCYYLKKKEEEKQSSLTKNGIGKLFKSSKENQEPDDNETYFSRIDVLQEIGVRIAQDIIDHPEQYYDPRKYFERLDPHYFSFIEDSEYKNRKEAIKKKIQEFYDQAYELRKTAAEKQRSTPKEEPEITWRELYQFIKLGLEDSPKGTPLREEFRGKNPWEILKHVYDALFKWPEESSSSTGKYYQNSNQDSLGGFGFSERQRKFLENIQKRNREERKNKPTIPLSDSRHLNKNPAQNARDNAWQKKDAA